MPKDRIAADARVDEWDEADDLSAERGMRNAEEIADLEMTPQTDTPSEIPDPLPEVSWREMMSRTPLWIWLISIGALSGICAMVSGVLLLIALRW